MAYKSLWSCDETWGGPEPHIQNTPDLPVVEQSTSSLEAVKERILGDRSGTEDWACVGIDQHLARAVELDPTYAEAHLMRAATEMVCGKDCAAALSYAQQARRHDYRLNEPYRLLVKALFFILQGEYDKTLVAAQQWVDRYPMDVEALGILAQLQEGTDEAAALETQRKILALDPSDKKAWRTICRILDELGRYDEARAELESSAHRYPDDGEAYIQLGEVLNHVHKIDEAIEAYDRSLVANPDGLVAIREKGSLLLCLGRYDEAFSAFEETLRRSSTDKDQGTAHRYLGYYYRHRGQTQKWVDDLDAWFLIPVLADPRGTHRRRLEDQGFERGALLLGGPGAIQGRRVCLHHLVSGSRT